MTVNTCSQVGCNAKPVVHAVRIMDFQLTGEQHFCEAHVQQCVVHREYEDAYYALRNCALPEEVPYQLCYVLFDDRYDGVYYFNAIFLKHLGGRHILCLGCGLYETSAVYYEIQSPTDLLLTHSLMREAIQALGGNVEAAVITDVTPAKLFRAVVRIGTASDAPGIEVDARPSDAVALAVACRADILVRNNVIEALCEPP